MPLTRPLNVLIVEDNVPQAESLELLLSQATAWKTYRACTGESAKQMAATHRPDVVILDWVMPGGDGRDFLAWLRARPETAKVPVIVSTGLDPGDVEGVSDDPDLTILPKVYDVGRLLGLLREAGGRALAAQGG